jgi:hypothetical protein
MLLAEFDTTGRPLFLPVSNGLFNAAGVLEDVASQQIVGSIQGLPVVTDPNATIAAGPSAARPARRAPQAWQADGSSSAAISTL